MIRLPSLTSVISDGKTENAGIAGMDIYVLETTSVQRTSRATSFTLEDNRVVSDHVINDPIKVQFSGYVSEIMLKESIESAVISQVDSNLGTISGYLGGKLDSVRSVMADGINKVNEATSTVNRAISDGTNIYKFLSNSSDSLVKTFNDFIIACWQSRQAITVSTKNEYFESMIIEQYTSNLNHSMGIATFSIAFKEVRAVESATVRVSPSALSNNSQNVNKGKQSGEESRLSKIIGVVI